MKNLGQLMKQAQEMQTKMAEMQERLAETEVIGQSGAGMVTVTLNGKGEMRSVKVDPSLIIPAEAEVMEDLITAAHNDALSKVEATKERRIIEDDGWAPTSPRLQTAVLSASDFLTQCVKSNTSFNCFPACRGWGRVPRAAPRCI